jgi:predicted nucleic acid-binding protein
MPGDFFDTNVLLYIASAETRKADQAEKLISAGGAISVQVLNELAHVARRKMQMTWSETHAFLNALRELLTVHSATLETHENGLALAERFGFSIYDAMIAASALQAGCDTLWSEDLQHGMVLQDSLRIRNPFRVAP